MARHRRKWVSIECEIVMLVRVINLDSCLHSFFLVSRVYIHVITGSGICLQAFSVDI